MNKIILKIKSMGFDTSNREKIIEEIENIGVIKIQQLARHKSNINDAINLYIADMRISRFFWRHIRRIEIKYRATILNSIHDYSDDAIFLNSKKWTISRDFLNKYTIYESDESDILVEKKNKKIVNKFNQIVYSHNKKAANKSAQSLFENASFGKSIDIYQYFTFHSSKFLALDSLITLRNRISHFHLLSSFYKSEDFKDFWDVIKSVSENNDKTVKNDKEFSELLQYFVENNL